jgi:hypothetical protein
MVSGSEGATASMPPYGRRAAQSVREPSREPESRHDVAALREDLVPGNLQLAGTVSATGQHRS